MRGVLIGPDGKFHQSIPSLSETLEGLNLLALLPSR